jgi:hypothetical protein
MATVMAPSPTVPHHAFAHNNRGTAAKSHATQQLNQQQQLFELQVLLRQLGLRVQRNGVSIAERQGGGAARSRLLSMLFSTQNNWDVHDHTSPKLVAIVYDFTDNFSPAFTVVAVKPAPAALSSADLDAIRAAATGHISDSSCRRLGGSSACGYSAAQRLAELSRHMQASLHLGDRPTQQRDGFRWETIVPPTALLSAAGDGNGGDGGGGDGGGGDGGSGGGGGAGGWGEVAAALGAQLRRHSLQMEDLSAVLITGVSAAS